MRERLLELDCKTTEKLPVKVALGIGNMVRIKAFHRELILKKSMNIQGGLRDLTDKTTAEAPKDDAKKKVFH